MQVRKLKCASCGANKVVANKTSYIYCDYCGEFMGYDFQRMTNEVTAKFSIDTYQSEDYQKYLAIVTALGQAAQQKHLADFEKYVVALHLLEIDLFPERYSPKMKQQAYRNQYTVFYKKFWAERLQYRFFEEQEALQKELAVPMQGFESVFKEGKVSYVFNDAMKAYFDIVRRYARETARKIMDYEAMTYYPEQMKDGLEEMMFKQTLAGFTGILDASSFKDLLTYLGLQEDYIELPEISLSTTQCLGCGHPITYPEQVRKIICEQCGVENKPIQQMISCMNCGFDFIPAMHKMETGCPQCGSLFIPVKNA